MENSTKNEGKENNCFGDKLRRTFGLALFGKSKETPTKSCSAVQYSHGAHAHTLVKATFSIPFSMMMLGLEWNLSLSTREGEKYRRCTITIIFVASDTTLLYLNHVVRERQKETFNTATKINTMICTLDWKAIIVSWYASMDKLTIFMYAHCMNVTTHLRPIISSKEYMNVFCMNIT